MRTKDPAQTRNAILTVAMSEIYRSGYHAVSIDKLVEKTKLTKGAFYHHFPTKKSLGLAVIDEVLRRMVLERWIAPVAAHKNPLKGLISNIKKMMDSYAGENLMSGCPLNNLAQELASSDSDFAEKIRSVYKMWIDETEKILDLAKERGFLSKKAPSRRLAEFVVANQEAAFAMGKGLQDRKIVSSITSSLQLHLEQFAL